MRRVILLSTFSKSKLAVMILFWSIMVIADILIICYSLFELFVREYFMGMLLLIYGISDIYGNWWHVSVGVEQINGRFAAGLPMSEQDQSNDQVSTDSTPDDRPDPLDTVDESDNHGIVGSPSDHQPNLLESDDQQPADDYKPRHLESDDQQPADDQQSEPESREAQHRRSRTNSLKQMFGFGHKSAEEEKMALRRQGLGLEPEDQSADTDETAVKRPLADAISDPLDRQALDEAELGDEHQSLNSRREAMAARHAESTAAMSDAPAGSTSDHKVGHGYDLNQIPTIRLAATPSPEERRVPGELAPDDWIDDDETDKIIKETLAKHQAAESDDADTGDIDDEADLSDTAASDEVDSHNDHDLAEDNIPAADVATDTADKADTSDIDDDDAIPADFDPDDDQAISKMIAQYDAEQSSKKKKSESSDEPDAEAE